MDAAPLLYESCNFHKRKRDLKRNLNYQEKQNPLKISGFVRLEAERTGFEPANQFCRLHAFQACLFNHSSTSP